MNDYGVYDDAIFINGVQATAAYNENTDPSKFAPGSGTEATRGMVPLNPGAWFVHKFDKRNPEQWIRFARISRPPGEE